MPHDPKSDGKGKERKRSLRTQSEQHASTARLSRCGPNYWSSRGGRCRSNSLRDRNESDH